jgi:hypothetical protein
MHCLCGEQVLVLIIFRVCLCYELTPNIIVPHLNYKLQIMIARKSYSIAIVENEIS